MTSVGSSVTSDYDEPESSNVIDYTKAVPAKSPPDPCIGGKPGMVPKRPLPLPRGAFIPSQSPTSKAESPMAKPPVSPRKPSEVSGSRTSTDDVKFTTLPSKGSSPGKHLRTKSDDIHLGLNKENGTQGKPPVPTKPQHSSASEVTSTMPVSVTSLSGKPAIPDKPNISAPGKPVTPLKPAPTVSGKSLSSTPNMKPVDSSGELVSALELKQSHEESLLLNNSSNSLTTSAGNKNKDMMFGLSDGKQGVQSKPIPAPRVKRRVGAAGLQGNDHEETHCVANADHQEECESPPVEPQAIKRPIPPPRKPSDSVQRVHQLATKLSLISPSEEAVTLSPSPQDVKTVTFQESNPVIQPSLKPQPGSHTTNHCQAVRSKSSITREQSPKPILPARCQTIGEVPPVRKTSIPVQKSGSAGQMLAAVVTKTELTDIRSSTMPSRSEKKQKKIGSSEKQMGSFRQQSRKTSGGENHPSGSFSSEEDEVSALRPSPSIRRRINGAFDKVKRAFGGGKKENDSENTGLDDYEELPQLSVVPKLRHVSISKRRSRSSVGVSEGEEEKGQLFQYVRVVSLEADLEQPSKLKTVVKYQFPPAIATLVSKEEQATLESVPAFCFPDLDEWKPVTKYKSETYSFVLTDIGGEKRFGYCRRLLPSGSGPRLPEVYCIISPHGCFDLYSKILDAVECRRAQSASAVFTFLQAVIARPFPSPGRVVKVKAFSCERDEMEELILKRPLDSAQLEHVDFDTLFLKLDVDQVLSVFGTMLLERHIIFSANKLSTLSDCVHAATALLYPFTWQHVYIPVLPTSLMDFCFAPSPYIMGVLSSSLSLLDMEVVEDDVLIVDFDKGKFVKEVGDEGNILPPKLRTAIKSAIRPLDVKTDVHTYEEQSSSAVIAEAFLRFFVETIGHYHEYLPPDESEEFNMEDFVKAPRSKNIKRFLGYFKNTQMLQMFVDQRADPQQRDTLHSSLFEKRLREYSRDSSKVGKVKAFGGRLKDFSHSSFHRMINKAKESGAILKRKFRGGGQDDQGSDDN